MEKNYDFKYLKYPNPRNMREKYTFLNGEWDIFVQNENKKIVVPYAIETKASLINSLKAEKEIIYSRTFLIDELCEHLLHFEGIDYEADIFINEKHVFHHLGCYSSFFFKIKEFIKLGKNTLKVVVKDSYDKSQLRGKQRTRDENYECWYTQYTGIYKDVYLEKCGDSFVYDLKVRGHLNGEIEYSFSLNKKSLVSIYIYNKDKEIFKVDLDEETNFKGKIVLNDVSYYDCQNPNLYDFVVKSKDDTLKTYFGFIDIKTKDASIYINDKKTYLKMILNQGYYKDKLVSGDVNDVLNDLKLIKEIGFNGIRVHQKQESNVFYYICDVLGLYLWSEIPSAYEFNENMKIEYARELPRIIKQNYNSPSIIAYVLFNESWGVPLINNDEETKNFIISMKDLALKYDNNRLIILNDGWFNLEKSDLVCLHEYMQDAKKFLETYKNKEYVLNDFVVNGYGKAFAMNNAYKNQPIIISEFGGASLSSSSGWGYGEKCENLTKFETQLREIFKTIYSLDYLSGFCYTQLSDVEQETNGLVYEDRSLKLPLSTLKEIVGGSYEI